MTLYLDTSVIVSLLVPDGFSAPADALIRQGRDGIIVSDSRRRNAPPRSPARSEQARGPSRKRRRSFPTSTLLQAVERVEIDASDIVAAGAAIRRLDLTLRTADAIHIAVASRLQADLATFDRRMAESARTLGVTVVPGYGPANGPPSRRIPAERSNRARSSACEYPFPKELAGQPLAAQRLCVAELPE